MQFINAEIGYGDVAFKGLKNVDSDLFYQSGRIQNRILLDFGEVNKNQRTGMQLSANAIDFPCLLKSIHAPATNDTKDTIVLEVHRKLAQGVQERFFLQYYNQNEMPISYPEFILFPENVIYVIPDQDSTIQMILEPIDLITHATLKV